MPITYKMLLEITKSKPSVIIHAFCKLQETNPKMLWLAKFISIRKNEGGRIPAIKFYREKTDVGLKEAKYAVDEYDRTGILEV